MAYDPANQSVVAFQSDPTKFVATVSVVGILPVVLNNSSVIAVQQGSVATVIIGGSIAASFTPPANQSVSGVVGASIIGYPNINVGGSVVAFQGGIQAVSVVGIPSISGTVLVNNGSVVAFQGGAPWANVNVGSVITISQGSVATVIIGGSIAASFTPPANQSVSGTVGANLNSTNASVITVGQGSIAVAIIAGSISATFTPPANQSVSGTVGASIIGAPPVTQGGTWIASVFGNMSVIGTVPVTQATTPWVITGSVQATLTPAANQSVSGTVGASIIGLPPVKLSDGTEILDFYEENQVDASTVGIAHMFKSNVSSSIMSVVSPANPLPVSVQGIIGISGNPSISGTVNIGTIPGSVVAFQGTTPWLIGSVYGNISGSVAATIVNTNVNVSGSVAAWLNSSSASIISVVQGSIAAAQVGTQISSISGTVVIQSIVGTYNEDVPSGNNDPGIFTLGVRNDTVASLVSANGDYTGWSTDSAGRHLLKPFAPDETRFDYAGSVVSGSVTLIAASAIGKRNYITDFWVVNTGSVSTLITFQDGSTSILGYTIAPAGGGSNSPGINMPPRTAPSQDLAFKATTSASILYMTVKGYQAP